MRRAARPLALFAALGLVAIAPASARAQCEDDHGHESGTVDPGASSLADIAVALSAGLADGPTEGYSEDPVIAAVQKKLHALNGMGASLSTSAMLDAAFLDKKFSLDDAKAFLDLRTRILDTWSDARRYEGFFWELDGEAPISPWQVDEKYMADLRIILAELGAKMDPEAKKLLEGVVAVSETPTVSKPVLDNLATWLKARPTLPNAAKEFSAKLDAARSTWPFDMYRGPNGFWRQAFSVAGATDPEIRAFAERADANKDGKVDLDEFAITELLVRMEKTYGTSVNLILSDDGRNFAAVKDGKFEIHIDRKTPAHDVEGVLAHEFGHVLLARYDKANGISKRDREAEADFVSGWVHGTMGFSLDDTGYGWMSRRWKYNAADAEHGDFRERVFTVGAGYTAATGKDLFAPPPKDPVSPDGPVFDP